MAIDAIAEAARQIATARSARTPLAALAPPLVPADIRTAYRIQRAVHDLIAPQAGSLAGYKIGCTSAVMQRYLGIPHPCRGGIFVHAVHDSGARLPAARYVRVGVECELALRIAHPPVAIDGTHTPQSVADAVDACFPAIELVDDRYVDWRTLGAPTLIADDFFAAGIVLGAPVSADILAGADALRGRAIVNGTEAGSGTGADILGHPLNALAWLANQLGESGAALRDGQIVMTGSFVQTVWLAKGDSARMAFDGLGAVEVSFR